ncbi:MAG: helix-turn-helix domain-containing protein [Myxococcales bacterium]|nr:helix-turn-helix domain-containing protein [Myxococcales bacterium]
MLRGVVRDELRAALNDQRGAPLRQLAAGDAYLSITKAARLADVAPGTIRTWIRRGRLPAKRAGRVFRIGRADLEAFLTRCAGREPDATVVKRAREIRRAA